MVVGVADSLQDGLVGVDVLLSPQKAWRESGEDCLGVVTVEGEENLFYLGVKHVAQLCLLVCGETVVNVLASVFELLHTEAILSEVPVKELLLVIEMGDACVTTAFQQGVLVCVTSKVFSVAISCLLCESTLRIEEVIKVFDALLVKMLKSSQVLCFSFSRQVGVCKEQSEEGIDLSFALALVANHFVAGLGGEVFWRNYYACGNNLTAKRVNQCAL